MDRISSTYMINDNSVKTEMSEFERVAKEVQAYEPLKLHDADPIIKDTSLLSDIALIEPDEESQKKMFEDTLVRQITRQMNKSLQDLKEIMDDV